MRKRRTSSAAHKLEMADAFFESIGIAELLPQEYQRGFNAGKASVSASLKIWLIPGKYGTGTNGMARWDDPGTYSGSRSLGTSASISYIAFVTHGFISSSVSKGSTFSSPFSIGTMGSTGSISVSNSQITLSFTRSGSTLRVSVDCHYGSGDSSGTWQLYSYQGFIWV